MYVCSDLFNKFSQIITENTKQQVEAFVKQFPPELKTVLHPQRLSPSSPRANPLWCEGEMIPLAISWEHTPHSTWHYLWLHPIYRWLQTSFCPDVQLPKCLEMIHLWWMTCLNLWLWLQLLHSHLHSGGGGGPHPQFVLGYKVTVTVINRPKICITNYYYVYKKYFIIEVCTCNCHTLLNHWLDYFCTTLCLPMPLPLIQ